MARIKVTGYLDTDDLPPEWLDLSHETGLSEEGFLTLAAYSDDHRVPRITSLEDLDTRLERV